MRIIFSAVAALVLTASPSFAGGDWGDGYYDGRGYAEYYGGYYGRYYAAPAYAYYPYYAPRVYRVPPRAYVPYDPYYYGGDCEIKRKWRHGGYSERLDCDD